MGLYTSGDFTGFRQGFVEGFLQGFMRNFFATRVTIHTVDLPSHNEAVRHHQGIAWNVPPPSWRVVEHRPHLPLLSTPATREYPILKTHLRDIHGVTLRACPIELSTYAGEKHAP